MKCTFCGKNIQPGYGKTLIAKDSKIQNFCKMKCEKNMHKLKRKPRYTKWTELYHNEKKKQ